VQLLAQIGEQLGIALKQAGFVQQIKDRATQLKQALEDLQQSQLQLVQTEKMSSLGQLVAGIAHEINNPVNFIHGNLIHVEEYMEDLLSLVNLFKELSNESEQEINAFQEQWEEADADFLIEDLPKTLKSMKVGTDRIRRIVLSLRNFSRLDEAEFKAANIHEGIDSTLLILGHRIKNIENRVSFEVIKNYGDIPYIECFPAQLNQVFMNCLANSLDAIEEAIDRQKNTSNDLQPRNFKVWIETRTCGENFVEVIIRDNGIGIESTAKDKIFDYFFTTKVVGKGTGLGLAIARKIIVEKHCGELKVNPELERGAEFMIRLPIKLDKPMN